MPNSSKDDLGKQIQEARRSQGLTLAQLGQDVGKSHNMLSMIERGLAEPSLATLRQLAKALDVDFVINGRGNG